MYFCPETTFVQNMAKPDQSVIDAQLDRVEKVISYLGYKSLHAFSTEAQINHNRFYQMKMGRTTNFPDGFFEFLEKKYPTISKKYIEKGIEPMVITSKPYKVEDNQLSVVTEYDTKIIEMEKKPGYYIPFFDVSAAAGNPAFVLEDTSVEPADRIHVNELQGAEVAISVYGDSMADAYPSGSIIALRRIHDVSIIPYGEAYVIETPDHRMLKYIKKGSIEDTVLCVSHNPAYEPFELPRKSIKKLWKVIGLIRRVSS